MPIRPLPATDEDADLVARLIARHGTQHAAARASGVAQPRLSRASVAGKGRRLSDQQRAAILVALNAP